MKLATLFNLQAATVTPRQRDESYFYDTASQLYSQVGAPFTTVPHYRNALGVRTETPVTKENLHGIYDDSIWLLSLDGEGVKHANQYRANTEPNYRYELRGTDGQNANPVIKGQPANPNLDNKRDLGRLPLGIYRYNVAMEPSRQLKRDVFKMMQPYSVERDINHDGYFNDEDLKLITSIGAMTIQDMHIHQGGDNDTWSAGCQTMPQLVFQGFMSEMREARKAGQAEFIYVLIAA